MIDITQEEVKNLFDYQDSGNLIRRFSVNSRAIKGQEIGSVGVRGYRRVSIDYTRFFLHRLIFLWHHGYMSNEIDHINGDKTDNRIENLRSCTRSQNSCNKKIRRDNNTGVKGISWHKRSQKFIARVCYNGKRTHIGYFDDIEEARKSVQKCRDELHGIFANNG